jgi:hypothetical protein
MRTHYTVVSTKSIRIIDDRQGGQVTYTTAVKIANSKDNSRKVHSKSMQVDDKK